MWATNVHLVFAFYLTNNHLVPIWDTRRPPSALLDLTNDHLVRTWDRVNARRVQIWDKTNARIVHWYPLCGWIFA